MAAPSSWPRFVALLPYRKRQDAITSLGVVANAAATKNPTKYQFGPIAKTVNGARTTVRLAYRAQQEAQLSTRRPDWKSDPSNTRILNYLFGTNFSVEIDRWGKMDIRLPNAKLSAIDQAFLFVELSNHLFHLAKFMVVELQAADLIPGDFEYKRYATSLSANPEQDIVGTFEEVFAQGHHRMMEFAVDSFVKTRNSLSAGPAKPRTSPAGRKWRTIASLLKRFVLTPSLRMIFPLRFRLTRKLRWGPLRTQTKAFKSQVLWYYWLVWHGLEDGQLEIEKALGGRAEATADDMQEIAEQLEWLVARRDSVVSKRDTLLGIYGVVLSIIFGGLQLGWSLPYFLALGALSLTLIFFVYAEQILETNSLAQEATALCTVFRWEAPAGRGFLAPSGELV